ELTKGRKPGEVVVKLDADPYVRSFRNSSTHVLAPKLDEGAIRRALKAGHAYVAHAWMCDATGFRFVATGAGDKQIAIMGDAVKLVDGLKLSARLPAPALVRLLCHGEEVARSTGNADFDFAPKSPGAYRLEAWLTLDG